MKTPPCQRNLNHLQCKHGGTKYKSRNDVFIATQLHANVRKHVSYKLRNLRALGRVLLMPQKLPQDINGIIGVLHLEKKHNCAERT